MIPKITTCTIALLFCLCAHATSLIPPSTLGTCVACHGTTGKAANPLWPNLGGQHAGYLYKQLQDMKQGKGRPAGVMQAILAPLNTHDLQALADYYAVQKPILGKASPKYLHAGATLYRGGNTQKKITACIACHGPGGEGNAQALFPALYGQNAPYTAQQLEAFQKKTRTQDYNHMMQDITHRMHPEDILAVANYIQGLHPAL